MSSSLRIISLCPSNTELIHALGLTENLVAVDNYSDYPAPLLQNLPRLGPDLHINMERVQELKPDLVLASLSVPGMERVVSALKATGMNYVVLSPKSLDDIYRDIMTLSEATNSESIRRTAVEVVRSLKTRVDTVRQLSGNTVQESDIPRIYWEWWPNPVFSPAADNWLTEISTIAGGVNCFSNHSGSQVKDETGELVGGSRADFYLAVWTGIPQHKVPVKKMFARPYIHQLPAYLHNRVYILSEGLYCRPSQRLIDGLEQLFTLLHPNLARQHGFTLENNAPIRGPYGKDILSEDLSKSGGT
ncbi:MAG: ABC transporter substrate-binding protein [Alicyclobacillaceae bacterium]|nr:ABC transporter substrate-binding protein [Alicyclobacillaceae bacterium]